MVKDLTLNELKEVLDNNKKVFIDFYADWCGPCQMMMPIVEDMAKKYDGKIKIGKVNTDQQRDLAAKFGVMSIPSFFFIKDGKVVNSSVGGMTKSRIEAMLDSLLSD